MWALPERRNGKLSQDEAQVLITFLCKVAEGVREGVRGASVHSGNSRSGCPEAAAWRKLCRETVLAYAQRPLQSFHAGEDGKTVDFEKICQD